MNLKQKAKQIRREVIDLLYKHKACHLGSNMSCVDILVALYYNTMRPEDKFILGKGWAAAAVYSILADKGYFSREELFKNYYQEGTKYKGLISHDVKGVETSQGSAGHGLPMAAGMALADEKRNTYCLISDGECDCGTTWESALFAAHHKLDNLIVIVDYNKLQAFGRTNEVLNLKPLTKKWESFGWNVQRINGHDFKEIERAFNSLSKEKPNVIIADTIKGKGISFAENKMEWHYYNLTPELYERAKNDLR
jgi:transketolase